MNRLYDFGREGILNDEISVSGDVRAMLVKSTYVFSNSHKFVSDLGAVDNGRTPALANKTYTAGVLDADDASLVAIDAAQCNAIIIYRHTGNDATSRLIAYIDTVQSGLPFTPAAGQTVHIVWDDGPNKIFKL